MLAPYLPILVMVLLAVAIAAAVILSSSQLGPQRPNPRKMKPFESGMEPIGPAMRRFPVKFYVVAMLFIVFDVEIIFLFPYALVFRSLGLYGLVVMGIFLIILVAGLAYELQRGALKWD